MGKALDARKYKKNILSDEMQRLIITETFTNLAYKFIVEESSAFVKLPAKNLHGTVPSTERFYMNQLLNCKLPLL